LQGDQIQVQVQVQVQVPACETRDPRLVWTKNVIQESEWQRLVGSRDSILV
jgi:hypothetical protein